MAASLVTKKDCVTGDSRAEPITAALRILATTDIHMQLIGYDYVADRPAKNHGLAGIATLIDQARAEARETQTATVLVDNGDMVQGTIIGDLLAAQPVTAAHPLVSCINAMRYDAIGLGNHDLDFGLPYLRDIASQLTMPLISTNLDLRAGKFVQRAALIKCDLPMSGHLDAHLKVGILSILPAKTAIWNHHVLAGQAEVTPAIASLCRAVTDLRTRGADLVILLAHMGIADVREGRDSDGMSIANLPGIDAIIAGHTHRRFPSGDHIGLPGVDITRGTIAKRPTIMPGNAASDLAVLDLKLIKSCAGKWSVKEHTSTLRVNTPETAPDPKIAALCKPAHNDARSYLAQRVGQTNHALHSYFSLAMPTDIAALTARAKARVVRDALADTADADTPLIASVAAHTAGGRGGPDHYLCIPKGPVLRRHIAGLTPYANLIWAVRITGADLRRQLEKTVSIYHTLTLNNPHQLLIDPLVPTFNFDTLFGVTYRINPTRPPGHRICALRHNGQPVLPNDRFILATNQFRTAGGGGIAATSSDNIALRSGVNISGAVIDALAHPKDHVWAPHIPWSFDCDGPVQATLPTAPAALAHLSDAAHLSPQHTGDTDPGFAKLRLTL